MRSSIAEPTEDSSRWVFQFPKTTKGAGMANHLTPDELSKEYGMKREDVIRLCHEQSVPIYHGKIDKSLFQTVREELALSR